MKKGVVRQIKDDRLFCKVFWGNQLIAIVFILPNGLYKVVNRTNNPVKKFFPKKILNEMEFKDILEMRCWDRNRDDIQLLLDKLGVKAYDPIEIVRKTNGISFNDPIWLKFPGDTLTYNEVRGVKHGIIQGAGQQRV